MIAQMIVCCCVMLSLDGMQFIGDQEYYDQHDQHEFNNQGKYTLGPTLLTYS
jgi:hypothetical protein